jgi:hypothetical protein
MNINLSRFGKRGSDPYRIDEDEDQTVVEALNEHLALLATAPGLGAVAFTGRQALLPETDLPDAYRVWNETATGTWIWINTDGVCIETFDPMRYVEGLKAND